MAPRARRPGAIGERGSTCTCASGENCERCVIVSSSFVVVLAPCSSLIVVANSCGRGTRTRKSARSRHTNTHTAALTLRRPLVKPCSPDCPSVRLPMRPPSCPPVCLSICSPPNYSALLFGQKAEPQLECVHLARVRPDQAEAARKRAPKPYKCQEPKVGGDNYKLNSINCFPVSLKFHRLACTRPAAARSCGRERASERERELAEPNRAASVSSAGQAAEAERERERASESVTSGPRQAQVAASFRPAVSIVFASHRVEFGHY